MRQPSSQNGSVTETRDLRTGISFWARSIPSRVLAQSLAASGKADVVIVGAGVTGALLALALARRGLLTVVLDRREPGHGSTMASTALLQWEIDTPLVRLAEQIGFERAARAWRRCFRAVDDLKAAVRRHRICCSFKPRRALYLAGDALGPSELAQEARWRQVIGLPSVFMRGKELREVFQIDRPAALLSDGVADLDPMRLTTALLRQAISLGARLFYPEQLAEVVPLRTVVGMATTSGKELEAKALVFATGYELPERVPARGYRRTSTWALATPPQPARLWPERVQIWEASIPYLYLRTTHDGRVVAGGEDEPFSDEAKRDALLSHKIAALQRKLRQLLPQVAETAEFAWAGTFGESETALPSIGAIPGMSNCYAVQGYGGNGFTFAVIASQIIAGQIAAEIDPDADLFAPRS
jgi:glycine/D-amino acid oxidase-like deaminating enzyme